MLVEHIQTGGWQLPDGVSPAGMACWSLIFVCLCAKIHLWSSSHGVGVG